jgi:ABC-type oligopeptide transport system substrate-binding subunit
MHPNTASTIGYRPRRVLTVLCAALAATAALSLAACETTSEVRSKTSKSSAEKGSTSKKPVKWAND